MNPNGYAIVITRGLSRNSEFDPKIDKALHIFSFQSFFGNTAILLINGL
ncbi:MAG: hypothetical protein CM1200mP29_01020 [Verrucomicrobiota bacterium]|nr:MAG: hypothetical protein CM1200mP29_01020 [Verrucomicrobiota bacterium]